MMGKIVMLKNFIKKNLPTSGSCGVSRVILAGQAAVVLLLDVRKLSWGRCRGLGHCMKAPRDIYGITMSLLILDAI